MGWGLVHFALIDELINDRSPRHQTHKHKRHRVFRLVGRFVSDLHTAALLDGLYIAEAD